MIKLKAEVDGQQHNIRIRRKDQLLSAEVDGRIYELEVRNPVDGEYLIRRGTHIYICRVETTRKQPDALNVNIREKNYAVHLIDPKRLRGVQSAREHDHGAIQIVASMPGKVVRLLVKVGSQVEAGAGIVVVEAMKMQNEMKSPKSGVVVSLNAMEGATVNAGDVLAVIE